MHERKWNQTPLIGFSPLFWPNNIKPSHLFTHIILHYSTWLVVYFAIDLIKSVKSSNLVRMHCCFNMKDIQLEPWGFIKCFIGHMPSRSLSERQCRRLFLVYGVGCWFMFYVFNKDKSNTSYQEKRPQWWFLLFFNSEDDTITIRTSISSSVSQMMFQTTPIGRWSFQNGLCLTLLYWLGLLV